MWFQRSVLCGSATLHKCWKRLDSKYRCPFERLWGVWGKRIQFHPFFTSALVQWPPSRSSRFTPRKDPTLYAANRRLSRPKNRAGCIGEEKQFLSSPGVEPRYKASPARSLSHKNTHDPPLSPKWLACIRPNKYTTSEISKNVASFLVAHTDVSCVPVSVEKNDRVESGKTTSKRTQINELLLPV